MAENIGQRAGPWSKDEKTFIAENGAKIHYTEIAKKLRRNPEQVKKYIVQILGPSVLVNNGDILSEYNIQLSPIWKQIKEQFSPEEQELFIYHWGRIISQFKDDVFPTEELQIIDSIKIELLLDRTLKHQRESLKAVEELEVELTRLKKEEPPDADKIDRYEKQVAWARTSMESLSGEYNKLLEKKNMMLKELKATRAERIKKIEDSKQTILGWISELIRDKHLRKELGLEMEKMRIAVEVEKQRLMEPHTFSDGMVDYAVLNAETMEQIAEEK